MRRATILGMFALAACQADAPHEGAEGEAAALFADGLDERTEGTPSPTAAAADGPPVIACRADGSARVLGAEIRETSGLARGRRNAELFWTHNDAGNGPDLFALDPQGNVVGRVRLNGATSMDWEDIEAGPCAAGDCLYVADIGDNQGQREFITIYHVPEPDRLSGDITPIGAFQVTFPDGRWDAEALFALPDGSVYVVTKGRAGPITLYAVPGEGAGPEATILRRIRDLLPAPQNELDRVTAATATPDGRWVALRTYRALLIYPADELVAGQPIAPSVVDLSGLGHPQGESVVMSDDGSIWLTSESEKEGVPPLLSRLRCELPA